MDGFTLEILLQHHTDGSLKLAYLTVAQSRKHTNKIYTNKTSPIYMSKMIFYRVR